jgi:hemoglobin
MGDKSLYERLGGYDAMSAVADDLLPRLQADAQLGRFWKHRGDDGIAREKQLLVDFLCSNAGGPGFFTGRGLKTTQE